MMMTCIHLYVRTCPHVSLYCTVPAADAADAADDDDDDVLMHIYPII